MNEIQVSAFWSKVDITCSAKDCWNWLGAKKPKGYGNVRIDRKYLLAHRVAFEVCNGPIPKGFIVCHICDNPSCCNPSHLMLGTTKSNAIDMVLKNRSPKSQTANRGENNCNAKLSAEAVKEIRSAYSIGNITIKDIAKKYGVSPPAIGAILKRKTWRHV